MLTTRLAVSAGHAFCDLSRPFNFLLTTRTPPTRAAIAGGVVGGLLALALLGLAIYLCLRRRRARSNQPPPLAGGLNADKGSPPMTHAQMVALKYQGYPSAGMGTTPTAAEESLNYSPVSGKPNGEIATVPYVSQKELQRAPKLVCLSPDPLPSQMPNQQPRSRSPSLGYRRRPAPFPARSPQRPVARLAWHRVPSPHNREGVTRGHEVSTIRPPSQAVTADQAACAARFFPPVIAAKDQFHTCVYSSRCQESIVTIVGPLPFAVAHAFCVRLRTTRDHIFSALSCCPVLL